VKIDYKVNQAVSRAEFIDVLQRSSLAERRPVDDIDCIDGMLANNNLLVSAWDRDSLVGVSRSLTDFHYACYLSDLAVDERYQNSGIGKELIALTQKQLGPKCKLILLAAPASKDFYQHIGFSHNERCWVLDCNDQLA
jgi:ribosomal protein S18 acetylase RimI-like enzyme